MNSFWDNVAAELEYLGMTNKALALLSVEYRYI